MASLESSLSARAAKFAPGPSTTALMIGIAVFAACAFGLLTRPIGFLAMIWPANAVMLGLLARLPHAHRAGVWVSAAAAYMAADLIAGTGMAKALLLNTANLCGVGAGYLVCRRLPKDALLMREPASALYVVLVSAVAATASALAGAVTDPFLFRLGALDAGTFWFATELVNYIALLPAILSAPNLRDLAAEPGPPGLAACVQGGLPAAALAVSCALAMAIGGPGAIAFAVAVLLWCGLVYPVFAVSIVAFLFSYWSLAAMSAPHLQDGAGGYDDLAMVSIRLAAFLIVLAPVTLSIVMRNRDELIGKLSLARQRVDLALEAGGIVATWDLDFARGDFRVEGRFPKLFEVETAGRAGGGFLHDRLANLIHPDDRGRVYDTLGAAIATGSDYRCRFRIVTPAGEIRWFAAFGKSLRERKGPASRLIGILIDITEQADAVEALEQGNRRFNIVSESIPEIVWSTDATGRHDYFNCRWTEFTGIDPENITPKTWEDLVHPQDKPRVDEAWNTCLATGKPYSIDYRFRHRDGSYRWLKVQAKPLRNADGRITRWYGTSTDIDDAKRLEAEREIVARELDHRIGNLFALVNGLVSLTARDGTDVKAVTEALRGRLRALHDAHCLIRRGRGGASATLADLLRRLLAPLATAGAASRSPATTCRSTPRP